MGNYDLDCVDLSAPSCKYTYILYKRTFRRICSLFLTDFLYQVSVKNCCLYFLKKKIGQYCPERVPNNLKIGFLKIFKNFIFSFCWNDLKWKSAVIFCAKYSQPNKFQNSVVNNISRRDRWIFFWFLRWKEIEINLFG